MKKKLIHRLLYFASIHLKTFNVVQDWKHLTWHVNKILDSNQTQSWVLQHEDLDRGKG